MVKKKRSHSSLRPQLFSLLAGLALAVSACVGLQTRHIALVEQRPLPVIVPGHVQTSLTAPPRTHVDCAIMSCLALTFDDGPSASVTPQILTTLEQADVPATFFVIGSHIAGNESLLQRMYRDGFEVGNHSWTHPDFTKLTPEQMRDQINQTQTAVIVAGLPAPRLFRPPYGAVNAAVRAAVPLTFAMWNVDPEDWNSKDPALIAAKISAQVAPGRIVDLHDVHGPTAQALPAVLADLKTRFQLVTVSELFSLAPGQRGEFYGR